ncbi:MAG TPA: sel1 repeat family protein [Campylobacterales bacterium]|nr:sel1 repeat family protein [Campylobacterales bacterium]HHS92997.1 sel1 repeat family protein [Campylobacterales bacterium]
MKKKIIIILTLTFTTLYANNFKNLQLSAHHGNVYAQYQLASKYQQNANNTKALKEAFKWYHKSARKGYSASQYQLALMFHYGAGVKQNFELAKLWFTRASKKGHPKAQSIMYRFYSAKQPQRSFAYSPRYSINAQHKR